MIIIFNVYSLLLLFGSWYAVQRKNIFLKRTLCISSWSVSWFLFSPHLFESKNKPTVIKKTAAKSSETNLHARHSTWTLKPSRFRSLLWLSGSYKAPQIPHSTASTLLLLCTSSPQDGSIDTSDPWYTQPPNICRKSSRWNSSSPKYARWRNL